MGILDDTAIFTAIIQQGSLSAAAKQLKLSNGLMSRRLAQLETQLGVTLIKRTTRQMSLTPEGEIFFQHTQKIQQELESAMMIMQTSANKPRGFIRVSAPLYYGRHYLTPIVAEFLNTFPEVEIDLILSNDTLDPVKNKIDLAIRGAGYLDNKQLKDSNLHMKTLYHEKIGLYASPEYLLKHGEPQSPQALNQHQMIGFTHQKNDAWDYVYKHETHIIEFQTRLRCNDIESSLQACKAGFGIGRYTELNAKNLVTQHQVQAILSAYDWGDYFLYVIYPHQKTLPKRARLLLDFIEIHMGK